MDGSNKKRLREDQDEDSCREPKQMRLDDTGLLDLQTKETSGTLPGFCNSLSCEYSMLLKSPWSCTGEDQVIGSGIRSTAIRKHLMENHCESTVKESSGADNTEVQGACIGRGSLFEAAEDELWRPPSPLSGIDALFSLDSQDFNTDDCTNLKDDSFFPCAASGFRIWEEGKQGVDGEDGKTEGIHFLYDNEVSDWILRAPLDQPLLPESFEFEISVPNV